MSQKTLFQQKSIGYEWINFVLLSTEDHSLFPQNWMYYFYHAPKSAGLGLKKWKLGAGFFLADVQKMYCQYCHVPHSPSCWVSCDCIRCEQTWDTKPSKLVIYRWLFQTVILNKGCSQAFITVFSFLHPPKNGSNETEDMWLECLWKKSILPKFSFIAKKGIRALVLCNSFASFDWVLFAEVSFYTTLA